MAIQCIPVKVIALLEGIRVGLGNKGQIRSRIFGRRGRKLQPEGESAGGSSKAAGGGLLQDDMDTGG